VTPNLKEIAFKVFKEKREIIPDKTQFYAQDSSSRGGGLRGGRGGGQQNFAVPHRKLVQLRQSKLFRSEMKQNYQNPQIQNGW